MRPRELLGVLWPVLKLKNFLCNKKGKLRILMYHEIKENELKEFERQIKMLKKNYNFLDFDRWLQSGKTLKKGIHLAITFDDGFYSAHQASQILDKYGIKGIFFTPTDFIDCKDKQEWDMFIKEHLLLEDKDINSGMRPMKWEEIKRMDEKGHYIGAHTLSHINIGKIGQKELEYELKESKVRLERRLQQEIKFFAFPFGNMESVGKDALKVAANYYHVIFSALRGFNDNTTSFLAYRRDGILPEYHNGYVRFIVEGGLDIKYKKDANRLSNWANEIRKNLA